MRGADHRKSVEQSSFELAWLDFVLLARQLVDDRHTHMRIPDPVPQF
jgi:hypothetical protein